MGQNDLLLLQVKMSDISILLDAIEGAFFDFDIMEDCNDKTCQGCQRKKKALVRLRDNILKQSPLKTSSK